MIIFFAIVFSVMLLIFVPIILDQRRTAHDLRQKAIYNDVVDRIVSESITGDMPRAEALKLLNAAKETYNESVKKSKNIQQTKFPEVHLNEAIGANSGNETSSKGEKSERKKPNRPARPDLDSNP